MFNGSAVSDVCHRDLLGVQYQTRMLELELKQKNSDILILVRVQNSPTKPNLKLTPTFLTSQITSFWCQSDRYSSRVSFYLNQKLTSKVWPARAQHWWELLVKLKESEPWTKFPLGQSLPTFSYTKSYITSQATRVSGRLSRRCRQHEVP